MQFADVQDTLGSMDSGTDIDYNTGDITDKATGITTGNVYDEVALTGGDSSMILAQMAEVEAALDP